MSNLIGNYVQYKETAYIVVEQTNGMLKILNPLEGNAKLHVKQSNVKVLPYPAATRIHHDSAEYLVTGKGLIISLVTGRAMKWGKEHGVRKAILHSAHQRRLQFKPVCLAQDEEGATVQVYSYQGLLCV